MKKRFVVISLLFVFGFFFGSWALTSQASASAEIKLDQGKWCPEVKARLETLIAQNAGKGKKVIFDFDNTLICRDIGEATFAAMAGEKKLTLKNIPLEITPPFTLNGKRISPDNAENITMFYEDFLSATKHQPGEACPYSNGYAWVVQIMAGMTPADILSFTEKAYAKGIARQDSEKSNLQETKINGYRQPFFYPEMTDLAGLFLKNGYDVYVISASNIWTVRWMVIKNLNPLIQARHGEGLGIAPDHVIGVSVLLEDTRTGELHKDPLLVRTNKAYANMNLEELANYKLTSQIVYPLTGYFGKVANIIKFITSDRPFLIAGDSPNDHPMLNMAENRLWITRLEKMGYQEKTVKLIDNSLPGEWLLQPVLYKKSPGFVSSQADLDQSFSTKPSSKKTPDAVVQFLKKFGKLQKF